MIGLLLSPFGRYLTIFALAAAWATYALHAHDKKVMSRVVAKIEQRNNANVTKAETARRSAEHIPSDRLFDRYFRD